MDTAQKKQNKKISFKNRVLFPKKVALAKRLLNNIILPNGEKVVFK